MPKRPRQHVLEDESRNRLHQVFEKSGWAVEDLRKDYGEDLLVKIFENDLSSPLLFFVQAKSTDHIQNYLDKTRKVIRFPVESGHMAHWRQFWETVILTIWDSSGDVTYWECVQNSPLRTTKRIHVHTGNVLDEVGLKRIHGIVKRRYKRLQQEREGAKALIDLLNEELGIEIEYEPEIGSIFLKYPSGEMKFLAFGRLGADIDSTAKKLCLSSQELLNALPALINLPDFLPNGAVVQKDMNGNVLQEWDTVEDFWKHEQTLKDIRDASD